MTGNLWQEASWDYQAGAWGNSVSCPNAEPIANLPHKPAR
jgi:hypothetical protein